MDNSQHTLKLPDGWEVFAEHSAWVGFQYVLVNHGIECDRGGGYSTAAEAIDAGRDVVARYTGSTHE